MINTLKYYLSTMFEKGYASFAIFITVFRELFAKYIFNDWEFVGFLFIAIILDTFFATLSVVKNQGVKSLSMKEAEKFLIKIFLYFGTLILSHILGKFTIHGKPNNYFTWIDTFLYSYMMAKEALSVFRNINSVSPSFISNVFIQKINRFQKTGNVSDLIKDEENENKQ